MAEIRRLLVPTDFTETSDRALDWAIELAARLGASITVMHAYEIPVVGFPDGALIPTAELSTRLADASSAALEGAVATRRGLGVPLTPVLREGVAWEEINRVAEEIDADMVVVGTHGRRGLARALLGSVAEHVMRTSQRPVLTIHLRAIDPECCPVERRALARIIHARRRHGASPKGIFGQIAVGRAQHDLPSCEHDRRRDAWKDPRNRVVSTRA